MEMTPDEMRDIRMEFSILQAELADMTGTVQPIISKMEGGQYPIPKSMAALLRSLRRPPGNVEIQRLCDTVSSASDAATLHALAPFRLHVAAARMREERHAARAERAARAIEKLALVD